jgi:molecular chaperone GrpE
MSGAGSAPGPDRAGGDQAPADADGFIDPVDDGIAVGLPDGGPHHERGFDPEGDAVGGAGTILTDAAALAAERDEYLTALQHLQADFENYKKRVARQEQERTTRATQDLVGKLLPALDALDLAVAHLATEAAEGGEGDAPAQVEATALGQARALLLDALTKEGLEPVDKDDVPFDPTVHDAVAHAGGEGGEPVVDQVLRAGYRWRGQMLRPAMVRVRG